MGKKMGINTKAVEARERKQAVKNAKNEASQKQKEEQYWKDDDKHVNRKLERQKEKEKKVAEERLRRQTNKSAYEEEMAELAKISAKPTKATLPKPTTVNTNKISQPKPAIVQQPPKITRFEIQTKLEEELSKEIATLEKAETETILDKPIEPNVNHEDAGEAATTIDEALQVLNISNATTVDKHPEKRVKSAYLSYESVHLPKLKSDNPNMRLSQLKQLLKKQWQKAPENPFNQVLRP